MPAALRRCLSSMLGLIATLALPASAIAGTGAGPVLAGAASNAGSLSGATAVAVSGNYAYTTAYWPGQLTAVNIADPANPTVAGSTLPETYLENASNVNVAGNYAFVVSKNRNASGTSNDDGTGNSLTIVDISNPGSPGIVGNVHDSNRLFGAYGVAVSGHYAYIAYQGLLAGQPTTPDTSAGGFSVVDLSTPASPSVVASIDNGPTTGQNYLRHATSVAISGHYAYVTAFYDARVTVIDISNPTNPTIVTSFRDATNLPLPADVAVQGNYAYVANQSSGSGHQFTVLDISNPSSPLVVASLTDNSLSGAYRIRLRGNFAYISASNVSTIAAIDISDPGSPRIVGSVQDAGHLYTTTGLDINSSGTYVIASSPRLSTESGSIYPPFPNNTGTVSTIQLDPNPISVAIDPASEPPSTTTQTSANFTFSVNDTVSAVACELDGAGFGPCTSPTTQQYGPLGLGSHTFMVQATDAAGNTATDHYTWTVGSAPKNTAAPAISGNAVEGQTLSASPGGWSGYPSPSFSYQWQRCDRGGSSCAVIPGATGASYVVQAADVAGTLDVVVQASNGAGSPASATSAATAVVTSVPQGISAPLISGRSVQGARLTATTGTWTGYGIPTLSYQWQRCNASGKSCNAIPGATSAAHAITAADVGWTLRCVVRGSNSAGSALAASGTTAVVTRNPTVALAGLPKGKLRLLVTVTATSKASPIDQILVALPLGLRFSGTIGKPAGSLAVTDLARRRIRFRDALRGGALVITLSRPADSAQVAIGAQAVSVSRALMAKLGQRKITKLLFTISYIDSHRAMARVHLELPVG
jgi:hypothetical protein